MSNLSLTFQRNGYRMFYFSGAQIWVFLSEWCMNFKPCSWLVQNIPALHWARASELSLPPLLFCRNPCFTWANFWDKVFALKLQVSKNGYENTVWTVLNPQLCLDILCEANKQIKKLVWCALWGLTPSQTQKLLPQLVFLWMGRGGGRLQETQDRKH